MKPRKHKVRPGKPISFRLDDELQEQLLTLARLEDLTFSQLIRRAVRHELQTRVLTPSTQSK